MDKNEICMNKFDKNMWKAFMKIKSLISPFWSLLGLNPIHPGTDNKPHR